jgi:1-phosphofructokinase family hexose kinase
MITVVAPNPSIDKLLQVSKLESGTIHRPHGLVMVPGGKGLNVARVAATLGAQVRVVGIAAGTAGAWIASSLHELGVSASWVWADGESRTCTSISDTTSSELTEFYEPGPIVSDEVWRSFVDLVESTTPSGQWLAVSGSLPPGVAEDAFATLLQTHPRHTAVDTSGNALRAATSASVELVKLNASEASELLGRTTLPGAGALPSLAAELRQHCGGTSTVVVTGGQDGAVMVDTDGRMLRARLPFVGNYAVGSGDAFLAGLLTAHQDGQSWSCALRLATAAAGANAEVPGAGLLSVERVKELAPLVEIQEVGN